MLCGNISMLSQAVTLVESSLPNHQLIAQEVIEKCLPYAGKSVRLGITGVPGAGKSTFIEALGMNLVNKGHKLAVIAVHSMVDFFLLLQLAGAGDELQGIKRGIMEMADGIAINKCDGSNVEKPTLPEVNIRMHYTFFHRTNRVGCLKLLPALRLN